MKAIARWKKRNYGRASISRLVGLDHLDCIDWPGWVLPFDVGDRVRLIALNRRESRVDPASVREIFISLFSGLVPTFRERGLRANVGNRSGRADLKLEPFCGRERSGSPQPKSRAKRGNLSRSTPTPNA
jgi:hypothetical protein